MKLSRLTKGLSEEIGPWWRASGKKPLWQQAREAMLLARRYRTVPTQYLRAQLYLADRGPDIADYLPFEMGMRVQMLRDDPLETRTLNDKLAFWRHMARHGLPSPPLVAARADGALLGPDGGAIEPAALSALVGPQAGDLLVKPRGGHFGDGIDRLPADMPDRAALLLARAGDWMVQPFLRQHPALDELYPLSVNTVRIATWLGENGPETIAAALKIGSGGRHVDNASAGGIVVGIDLARGALFPLATPASKSGTGRIDRHPDSGARFEGRILPHWPALVELAHRAAGTFPGTGTIGWDIAILPDGPMVIEGNRTWGTKLFQMAGIPLARTQFGRAVLAQVGR